MDVPGKLNATNTNATSRAWYGSSIAEFLTATPEQILGTLTAQSDFAILPSQRDAWLGQIHILTNALSGIAGSIFLEFSIPRMGRRIDAAILVGPVVFAVEFKVGESKVERAAISTEYELRLRAHNPKPA
jgi:hypothetical protein